MPDLADRLNELFRTVRRPGGTDLWNNETAAYEISRSGPSVSAAYLSQLRTGKRINPSARHLAALAALFGVPMEFFFPPEQAGPPTAKAPSPAVGRLFALLNGISTNGLAGIEAAILRVRAAEQLPPVAGEPPYGDLVPPSTADGRTAR